MNLLIIKPNKKIFLEVKKYKGEVFKMENKLTSSLPHLTIFNLKINKNKFKK